MNKKNKNYLLRNIDVKLWDKAKHQAIDDKISLKDLIFRALSEYITKRGNN